MPTTLHICGPHSRNVELTLMDSSDVVVVVSDVEEQVIKHYRPDATVCACE